MHENECVKSLPFGRGLAAAWRTLCLAGLLLLMRGWTGALAQADHSSPRPPSLADVERRLRGEGAPCDGIAGMSEEEVCKRILVLAREARAALARGELPVAQRQEILRLACFPVRAHIDGDSPPRVCGAEARTTAIETLLKLQVTEAEREGLMEAIAANLRDATEVGGPPGEFPGVPNERRIIQPVRTGQSLLQGIRWGSEAEARALANDPQRWQEANVECDRVAIWKSQRDIFCAWNTALFTLLAAAGGPAPSAEPVLIDILEGKLGIAAGRQEVEGMSVGSMDASGRYVPRSGPHILGFEHAGRRASAAIRIHAAELLAEVGHSTDCSVSLERQITKAKQRISALEREGPGQEVTELLKWNRELLDALRVAASRVDQRATSRPSSP